MVKGYPVRAAVKTAPSSSANTRPEECCVDTTKLSYFATEACNGITGEVQSAYRDAGTLSLSLQLSLLLPLLCSRCPHAFIILILL